MKGFKVLIQKVFRASIQVIGARDGSLERLFDAEEKSRSASI